MTFTLRQITRSRSLRALGAAPLGGMGAAQAHLLHAAAAASGEHAHLTAPAAAAAPAGCADRSCCNDQAGCCDGLALHGCSCAAMCSASLPPESLITLTTAGVGRTYALPPSLSAPSLHAAPPLRPPVA